MSIHHIHECLNIMAYQFSSAGNNIGRIVTQTTVLDTHNEYREELVHVVDTGLNFVIVDKDDSVCAIGYGFDVLDTPSESANSKDFDFSHLRRAMKAKSTFYSKYMKNPHKYSYGEMFCDVYGVVRPDKVGSKIGYMISELMTVLAIAVGYKAMFFAVSHPATIQGAKNMQRMNYIECDIIDFNDITLTNGKHIEYYYDKLQKEKGYSAERMEQIRRNSKWGLIIIHFDLINFRSEDLFDRALEYWCTKRSVSLTRAPRQKL